MSQAAVAAALACQSRVHGEWTAEPRQTGNGISFWPVRFDGYAPATAAGAASNPMSSWFIAARAWQSLAQDGALAACGAGLSAWPTVVTGPAASVSPWSMYQAPFIATMLFYGVPYAVAAPVARGSTSAMDAADAAYAQWRLIWGSDAKGASAVSARMPWLGYSL